MEKKRNAYVWVCSDFLFHQWKGTYQLILVSINKEYNNNGEPLSGADHVLDTGQGFVCTNTVLHNNPMK